MKNKSQLIQTIIAAVVTIVLIVLIVKPSGNSSFNNDASTYFDMTPEEVQQLIQNAGLEYDESMSGDYDGYHVDMYRDDSLVLSVDSDGYTYGIVLNPGDKYHFGELSVGDTYEGAGNCEKLVNSGWAYDNGYGMFDYWKKDDKSMEVGYENGVITYIMVTNLDYAYESGELNEEDTTDEPIETTESTDLNENEESTNIDSVDTSEYIFYDSDKRYLNAYDVEGMDAATIRLAINEIYARHGRAFETEDLKDYFSSKSWYMPIYSQEEFATIEDSVFNDYEKANIEFLAGIRDGLTTGFTTNWIYGTYEIHDGNIDAIAEIGSYSDSGEDYLNLSGSTANGSAFAEFSGIIRSSKGDSYTAVDDDGNVIDFIYNGVDSIEIVGGQVAGGGMGFPGFEGLYQKMTEF